MVNGILIYVTGICLWLGGFLIGIGIGKITSHSNTDNDK